MRAPKWLLDLDASVRRFTTPAVRWLIYVNLGIWLTTTITFVLLLPGSPNEKLQRLRDFHEFFGCTRFAILRGWVWQFGTYMFLHADISHVFFNMLMLFFFGPILETRWGTRRFVRFYLLCGVGASVLYEVVILSQIYAFGADPTRQFFNPMIGASGALYGVMFAFAFYHPDQTVLLGFLIPIPARVLVALLILLSVVGSLSPGADNTAHLCHLAGMGVAYLYLKWPDIRFGRRGPRKLTEREWRDLFNG